MAIRQVPCTKSGGFVTLDTETMPQEVYEAALAEGLKSFVNKGMAKIQTKGLEGDKLEEAKAAAQAKAEENARAIMDGTIRLPGKKTKAKGASGKVMTEARRLARNLVKDAIKADGGKVSHYKASEITKVANLYLESELGPDLIKQAEANLAERLTAVPKGLDLKSILKEDPKLVAKAESEKAAKKSQLSAKQAGMTKKSKPGAGATAH